VTRLDFALPSFRRIAWVSDAARARWEPRIAAFGRAWTQIEWRSVVAGIRRCAVVYVSPVDLLDLSLSCAQSGLCALPIAIEAVPRAYAARSLPAEPGRSFQYRVVVGSPADVAAFAAAREANDERATGALLGYPACCVAFFERVWKQEAFIDTTWAMATNGSDEPTSRVVEIAAPPEANVLLRWIGVRLVPHLPCSAACEPSAALGAALAETGRALGYDTEVEDALALLAAPLEWSALHGLAEIRTPVVKICADTDATAEKYVVRQQGSALPDEAARGVAFPYRTNPGVALTRSRPHAAGLEARLALEALPSWHYEDNGFRTRAQMHAAHDAVTAVVALVAGERPAAVLDLGCGNGELLRRIVGAWPHLTPYGIDKRPERIRRAGIVLPALGANAAVANLFEPDRYWPADRRFGVVLLMPGRLIEATPGRRALLLATIAARSDAVVLYGYGHLLRSYGSIAEMAAAAGIACIEATSNGYAALADLASFTARAEATS